MSTHQRKIQHLYLRAGFGATPQQVAADLPSSLESLVERFFGESDAARDLDFISYPLNANSAKGASGFKILKMILKSRREMEDLNIVWMNRMASGHAMLREKMTLFWHNHFATSTPFGYLMQQQNNTLRRLALGRFGDLLHAVARDPAMILYLNNQQNKKDAPNENFAREVMELFTLGEGHYSETDIKEAARAFTGWTVNRKGAFEFVAQQHDDSVKEFLGQKGNFNGDDIIRILLEQEQTAVFITGKIYRDFVNDRPDMERIRSLASSFFDSGYDIAALMKNILMSEWFYQEENMGSKICSPVELLVRLKRIIDLQFEDDTVLLKLQKALGQVLFFPPNVAGWKGGTAWIDSSSLMLRMSLAQAILHKGRISFGSKPGFEDRPAEHGGDEDHKLITDWSLFTNGYKDVAGGLQEALADFLIQCHTGRIRPAGISVNHGADTPEDRIIRTAARLMSLPGFQLI